MNIRKKLKPVATGTPSSVSSRTTITAMFRRPLFKNTISILFLISVLYAFCTAFLSRRSSTLESPPFSPNLPQIRPVKVYLYHLPRKFTYGVIEKYMTARGDGARVGSVCDEDLKYPGHQHSAEWWLFLDMLGRRGGSPSSISRVSDPEEADLFYVPFFSSLSLIVNPIRQPVVVSDGDFYSDDEMQVDLVEWLEQQYFWRRYSGRDHVFVCQDPNALYKVIDTVKNGVLLVSDFGRLRADQASLLKDVILPYSHRINTFRGDIGVDGRKSLLFFMGNRYRKEGGKIRDLLFRILETEKDVVIKHGAQSRESRRMATHGMHSSKFCLHPAGDTPSACRLFDAIVSLCVPVIVSDNIELPFEDVIDYRKIAIFVGSESALKEGYLVNMLRGVSTESIIQYQQALKMVRHYFEYEDPMGTVNEVWRQVSTKLSLIKLMINRDQRLVSTNSASEPLCSCSCSNDSSKLSQVYVPKA